MDILQAVIAQKRKQVEDIAIDLNGAKMIKRADLCKKEREAYAKRQEDSDRKYKESQAKSDDDKRLEEEIESTSAAQRDIPRAEVIRRLRARAQPILLFGETEAAVLKRLRRLEIEQPELKEGWKNEFQAAMNQVDREEVEEVINKGKLTTDDAGRHNVTMPGLEGVGSWDWAQIAEGATKLGEGDDSNRDCDIIREFILYMLKRWGRELNERSEEVKRSAKGRAEAGTHHQTVENVRPLVDNLVSYACNYDIRVHLIEICRLCIIERDYIRANNAYMQMAIGNAPWPVGVTRSGIHQRPGSAKAYVANIAHVLNDETQRKYIHALKRLISRCQVYFPPSGPSKCVEYVKRSDSS